MSEQSQAGTPIQLKFVTEISDRGRKENVAFEANGLYYIKGNSTYLSFHEPHQAGDVKTIIKINDSDVLILRSGAVKMRQLYKKKEETKGTYQNQAGTFEMKTKTNTIEYRWYKGSRKGKLFLSYLLTLHGEAAGRYTITILFRED